MLAVFWRLRLALNKHEVQVGVGLGAVYAMAQILQTVGLAHTEASRSGSILLHERISRSTWVAVFMATAGLATLSLNGSGSGSGETVT